MADFNDFGLLVAEYSSTLPTLTDTQKNELQVDVNGRLIISGRYLEDAAHSSGDAGLFMLAVRNDADSSLVSTDGDYAPLQVDENGRLKVVADLEVTNSHEKAEDSAHVSADIGSYVLAVRSDVRPTNSNVSADGDYASFFINDSGELYVHDTDVLAQLVTIDGVLDNIYVEQLAQGVTLDSILSDTNAMVVDLAAIEVELLAQGITLDGILSDTNAMVIDLAAIEVELLAQGVTLDSILSDTNAMVVDLAAIEAELLAQGITLDSILVDTSSIDSTLTALSKAEDAAHSSGDQGIMALAVRNDTEGSLVDTDGDYASLQLDSLGRLRTVADVTLSPEGSEEYTVTDALAAAGDGLETITAAATPWVDVATFSHTSGTAYLYGYQWACDQNAQFRIITDDTSDIIVYKTGINSSAQPGDSEHFGLDGRIEIAGAASLEIKLQIKKRSTPGGNAQGTGSLHIRK